MTKKTKRILFKMKIFCNILNIFTVKCINLMHPCRINVLSIMYYDVKYALYFLILLAPIICFHKKIMLQKKFSTWIIRNIS